MDFELFKQAFYIVKNKEHLTDPGLKKILAIKASLNLGFSDELKASFPDIIPAKRSITNIMTDQDPYWFPGFTSAEGCFLIQIYKSNSKLGVTVKLIYQLVQHSRDEQLVRSFIEYFDCGILVKDKDAFYYRVSKFSDLCDKIIPFFNKYLIQGIKLHDYLDWCKVSELMKNNAHKTEQGLEEIRQIKAGINKGRTVLNCVNTLSQKSLKSSRRFFSVYTRGAAETNLSKEYTSPKTNLSKKYTSFEIYPWFVTGFWDAKGYFMIIVRKTPKYELGCLRKKIRTCIYN